MLPVVIPEGDLAGLGKPYERVTFGAGQPEYKPLVAIVIKQPDGPLMLSRWQPSEEERQALVAGAAVELLVWTHGAPLQPVMLGVEGVESEG